MSNYLPIPPRAWSRVQNPCTYINPNDSYTSAYIPLTNQTVSLAQANYEDKLQYKGNILQYKGNSSQLTKRQKYSQIAKCLGPSRTKIFATQSQTYTNPNITGLLRVNSVSISNSIVGAQNYIAGPYHYNIGYPFGCSSDFVEDGGNLVCGTYANPCTGEILKTGSTTATICNPSYCSDVPGRPVELCWNYKAQTWFPKQRYFMNNSGNKWPQGYKAFVSAVKPKPPTNLIISVTDNTVTLKWSPPSYSKDCYPVSYNIYVNDQFVGNTIYTTYTINSAFPEKTVFSVASFYNKNLESEKISQSI
jgi:hypothetical protein